MPDPWQQLVLDSWLGISAKDMYTSPTCGLLVPRQNGKNALIEMREFYGVVLKGEKILHTAHEVRTAKKAFNRICSFFENEREYPELAELVSAIRKTNGQEAVVLSNGGSVEFSARSKGAARGFTVDVVICDEAQFMSDEQIEALMYTKSAAPLKNPQMIFTGTPPSPEMGAEVLGRMRKEALSQKSTSKGLSWHEWSVKDVGDVTDQKRWYETNPALGIRISEKTVTDELAISSEEGFARERLGLWLELCHQAHISSTKWDAIKVENPPNEGKVAFGIKFAPDGSTVAIAAAIKPDEGLPHTELVEYRPISEGVSWVPDWIIQREDEAALFVIDGQAGAGALVDTLYSRGVSKKLITLAKPAEMIAAVTMLDNAIKEKQVTVRGDQEPLNESALNARKRPIGNYGGWGWGSIGQADITPLEAVTLAHWGVLTTKRDPRREMEVILI